MDNLIETGDVISSQELARTIGNSRLPLGRDPIKVCEGEWHKLPSGGAWRFYRIADLD
jgi:hypothetical protein